MQISVVFLRQALFEFFAKNKFYFISVSYQTIYSENFVYFLNRRFYKSNHAQYKLIFSKYINFIILIGKYIIITFYSRSLTFLIFFILLLLYYYCVSYVNCIVFNNIVNYSTLCWSHPLRYFFEHYNG